MALELLVFTVDDTLLAVPTANVKEVLRAAALFALPESNPVVEGGLNLRGDVVRVVDARAFLSRPSRPLAPSDHLIVLQWRNQTAAIRVDRALEIARDDSQDLMEGSHTSDPPRTDPMGRMIHTSCGPTTLLRLEPLFASVTPMPSMAADSGGNLE